MRESEIDREIERKRERERENSGGQHRQRSHT